MNSANTSNFAANFYAVANGRKNGVYENWPMCLKQVQNFPNAIYKKFSIKQEAIDYVQKFSKKNSGPFFKSPKAIVIRNVNTKIQHFGGIAVKIPEEFNLYGSQKLMLARMMAAFKSGANALLESPTGSGKTLVLINGACAFLEHYKNQRENSQKNCPVHNTKTKSKMAANTSGSNNCEMKEDNSSDEMEFDIEETQEGIDAQEYFSENQFIEDTILDWCDNSEQDENINTIPRNNTQNSEKCRCLPKMKIFYATRTHLQIEQAIKEFGKCYNLKHTILASREHTCINAMVRLGNSAEAMPKCKDLVNKGKCQFKTNLAKYNENVPLLRKNITNSIGCGFNLEELATMTESIQCCPYYTSNHLLARDAEIIFCPFTYILDPLILTSTQISTTNSLVIIDEGHNIDDVCREVASFDFDETSLELHIDETRKKIKLIMNSGLTDYEEFNEKIRTILGFTWECAITKKKNEKYLEKFNERLKFMGELILMLNEIKLLIMDLAQNMSNKTKILNSDEIKENLERFEQLNLKNMAKVKRCIAYLTKTTMIENVTSKRIIETCHECQMSSAAITCAQKFFTFLYFFDSNPKYYKCKVVKEENQYQKKIKRESRLMETEGIWLSKPNVNNSMREIQISFWCLMPSVAFKHAFDKTHSVIISSGTLKPIELFNKELGTEFSIKMEKAPQVIKSERIFASILTNNSRGLPLIANYENMKNENFITSISNIIAEICLIVPKGILCFVSNYTFLGQLYDELNNMNVRKLFSERKKIFKEPNSTKELPEFLINYDKAINHSREHHPNCDGALLLAVFRGKFSEGIDFRDDRARAVLCIGIPFPNIKDELILEKKKFNDQHVKSENLVSGNDWYSIQAFKALNQAIGRGIRHELDWAALVLIDARLSATCAKFPEWFKNEVKQRAYQEFCQLLKKFVKERSDEEEQRRILPRNQETI